MIVDSHQHFWNTALFDYAWIDPADAVLNQRFEPQDFAETAVSAGISHVVAVQAHQSVGEARWLLNLCQQFGFLAGVVGWVDLLSESLPEVLDELCGSPYFKGVRHVVQDEPDPEWLLRPQVVSNINLLADYGLSYDILVFSHQLKCVPELIAQCPRTEFVIDHLAKPPIARGEREPWRTELRRVASFPNVHCKLSGMVTEADHKTWSVDDLRPFAADVLEMFGPERLMFGSDYPVCLLAADYGRVLETAAELLHELSDAERAAVMGHNAFRFYRLGPQRT